MAHASSKYDRVFLPKTVSPISYNLSMVPDLKTCTFKGEESILVRVNLPTDHVVVHRSVVLWEGLIKTTSSIIQC